LSSAGVAFAEENNTKADVNLSYENYFQLMDGFYRVGFDPGIFANFSTISPNTSWNLTNFTPESEFCSANLGWISWDPQACEKGRHAEYGRKTTDLVGVFSIDMNIKLASSSTCGSESGEWLSAI